jgi:hypothetical protein
MTSNDTLSKHFSKPIFADSYSQVGGNLEYVGTYKNKGIINSGSVVNSLLS